MKILHRDYTVSTQSYDIFVSGCACRPHCDGCHNPESWNFMRGTDYKLELESINVDLTMFKSVIKKVFILGGEPLDQDLDELAGLIKQVKHAGDIYLFTHYEIEQVPEKIKKLCNYIKCGRYIKDLTVDCNIQYGIKLATSNQKIFKIS